MRIRVFWIVTAQLYVIGRVVLDIAKCHWLHVYMYVCVCMPVTACMYVIMFVCMRVTVCVCVCV